MPDLRKVRKSNKFAVLRFVELFVFAERQPFGKFLKVIYKGMYCVTARNKWPSIKSDSVERWRGVDYRVNTGRSNGPARLGEGGGAALVVSGNRR
jgi:hypothetical protein